MAERCHEKKVQKNMLALLGHGRGVPRKKSFEKYVGTPRPWPRGATKKKVQKNICWHCSATIVVILLHKEDRPWQRLHRSVHQRGPQDTRDETYAQRKTV